MDLINIANAADGMKDVSFWEGWQYIVWDPLPSFNQVTVTSLSP